MFYNQAYGKGIEACPSAWPYRGLEPIFNATTAQREMALRSGRDDVLPMLSLEFDILLGAGWRLEIERPCLLHLTEGAPMTHVDGVQGWRNPALLP